MNVSKTIAATLVTIALGLSLAVAEALPDFGTTTYGESRHHHELGLPRAADLAGALVLETICPNRRLG
ncbi:MAG: hypothetical protein JWQ36_841 [Enterovirga sp.]|nr:hypothetical protein [Enterovirga sp.]